MSTGESRGHDRAFFRAQSVAPVETEAAGRRVGAQLLALAAADERLVRRRVLQAQTRKT